MKLYSEQDPISLHPPYSPLQVTSMTCILIAVSATLLSISTMKINLISIVCINFFPYF